MISAGLLHEIAVYVDQRIAKVVLNETYTISEFEVKAVTESTIALNYIVPASDVSLITLVELKDAADNILASNTVNVPITADHMMLQTIFIKEAV